MLVESKPDAGMATVLRTPRVQNVSHHIKTPVTTNLNTGTQTLVKTPRGTVSPRYKFDGHQPSDIASIFTGLQARTPIVFEWAGQIDNGLAVFAVARVTERDRLYNDEPVEHFLLIRDGLDGSMIIGQQSALPFCANAYSTWLSNARICVTRIKAQSISTASLSIWQRVWTSISGTLSSKPNAWRISTFRHSTPRCILNAFC